MTLKMEDVDIPVLGYFDKLPVGKYRGSSVEKVLDEDPEHLNHLRKAQSIQLAKAVEDELNEKLPARVTYPIESFFASSRAPRFAIDPAYFQSIDYSDFENRVVAHYFDPTNPED